MTFRWIVRRDTGRETNDSQPTGVQANSWPDHYTGALPIPLIATDVPVSEVPGFLCFRKWKAIFLSPPMLYLFNLVFSAQRMLKLQESACNILLYLVTVWTQQHRCYSYVNRFCGSILKGKHSPDLVSLFGRASRGNPVKWPGHFPQTTSTSKLDWI